MFALNFDKARAEHFLRCIETGEPVGSVHNVDEMVAMAGACFFALMSHGKIWHKSIAQAQGKSVEQSDSGEHREADQEMIYNDLHAVIEFVGMLTMMVKDGQFDERFEPTLQCFVNQDDGKQVVKPIRGFKKK